MKVEAGTAIGMVFMSVLLLTQALKVSLTFSSIAQYGHTHGTHDWLIVDKSK